MAKYETRSDFQQSLWDRLGGSGQGALQLMLKKKLQEQQRQKQMEDFRKKLEIQKEMGVLNQPSTQISITERPYSEILKAQEILGRQPKDYYEAGMATPGMRKKGTGILGSGFGFGSEREYTLSPEAQTEQSQAQQVLANPYRTTKRISYKGTDTMQAGDVESQLPDASSYEEGTEIQDDEGNVYVLEGGEWVLKS